MTIVLCCSWYKMKHDLVELPLICAVGLQEVYGLAHLIKLFGNIFLFSQLWLLNLERSYLSFFLLVILIR
jgi:hypothetical protein